MVMCVPENFKNRKKLEKRLTKVNACNQRNKIQDSGKRALTKQNSG